LLTMAPAIPFMHLLHYTYRTSYILAANNSGNDRQTTKSEFIRSYDQLFTLKHGFS